MEENSDWLEVLDPDDPPLQAEGGDGGPPHSQTKAHTGRLKSPDNRHSGSRPG